MRGKLSVPHFLSLVKRFFGIYSPSNQKNLKSQPHQSRDLRFYKTNCLLNQILIRRLPMPAPVDSIVRMYTLCTNPTPK